MEKKMIRISKIDAFRLVAKEDENGNAEIANKILNIIFKSLMKEKNTNIYTDYIEINRKESIYFKDIIDKQEQD